MMQQLVSELIILWTCAREDTFSWGHALKTYDPSNLKKNDINITVVTLAALAQNCGKILHKDHWNLDKQTLLKVQSPVLAF